MVSNKSSIWLNNRPSDIELWECVGQIFNRTSDGTVPRRILTHTILVILDLQLLIVARCGWANHPDTGALLSFRGAQAAIAVDQEQLVGPAILSRLKWWLPGTAGTANEDGNGEDGKHREVLHFAWKCNIVLLNECNKRLIIWIRKRSTLYTNYGQGYL